MLFSLMKEQESISSVAEARLPFFRLCRKMAWKQARDRQNPDVLWQAASAYQILSESRKSYETGYTKSSKQQCQH